MKFLKVIYVLVLVPLAAISQNNIPRPTIYFGMDQSEAEAKLNSVKSEIHTGDLNESLSIYLFGESQELPANFNRYQAHSGIQFLNNYAGGSGSGFGYQRGGFSADFSTYLWGIYPFTSSQGHGEEVRAFTVAGWFYKGENDHKFKTLFEGKKSGRKSGVGLTLKNESLYLRRYADGKSMRPSYDYKLGKDLLLNEGSGWYYIALVQSKSSTLVYLGRPGGSTEFKKLEVGKQDMSEIRSWSVGNGFEADSGYYSIDGCDDFMVWDTGLSIDQLQALFYCSKDKDPNHPSTPCWAAELTEVRAGH